MISNEEHESSHHEDSHWELLFAIAAGVTYIAGLISEHILALDMPFHTAFYLATYFFGAFFMLGEVWRSFRKGHFNVDFLMIVAALGAATIGKFGEGAVLLFLFSLGHALEEYSMSRATRSIEELADLAPRTAIVRIDAEHTEERPVEKLHVGDTVVVRPHSQVPSDGFIVLGNTTIDQSAVTGESIPIEKSPVNNADEALNHPSTVAHSSQVFAGTLNGPGAFEMLVTATSDNSTLSRVVTLIQEAQVAQSPTQRAIDRFQRIYVPAVIIGVLLVFAVGAFALDEPLSNSFYRSMLVLVSASPCALALATPSAILASISRAGRSGILVKGGAALELLGQANAMAFDKTGTLTWGYPRVTDTYVEAGVSSNDLQAVALSVEALSDHPLATAIVRDLSEHVPAEQRLTARDLTSIAGRGVSAYIGEDEVIIGNLRMMHDADIEISADTQERVDALHKKGRTTMLIARSGRLLGLLGMMDLPKAEAHDTLNLLRNSGIKELVVFSGDNRHVVDNVGQSVGADRAIGELLPEDKAEEIRALHKEGYSTVMIGDGVNDAPAMAVADLGIAMGAAGSATALETADIALMADDLGRLPFMVRLSRNTTRIIRQNLFVAMIIVVILVAVSLWGASMGPIILIHEGSTIAVVLNALRLLRFDNTRDHEGIEHEEHPAKTASALTTSG
ncbi:MAG: heavy metal translocating P-type ATPase [Actinobacteria bacterium]|nr:MAG: heavy metal translocating P-type ATPase [Actinomycetota bacterium]